MDNYDVIIEEALENDSNPEEVINLFVSNKVDTVFDEIKSEYSFPKEMIDDLKFHFNNYILQIENDEDFFLVLGKYKIEQTKEDTIKEKLFTTIIKPLLTEIHKDYVETEEDLKESEELLIPPILSSTPTLPQKTTTNLWQNKLQGSFGVPPTQSSTNIKPQVATPLPTDPYKEIPN